MNSNFEFISNLQYRVKALSDRVRAFESGDKYVSMETKHKALLRSRDLEIRKLKAEAAVRDRQFIDMRHKWEEVFDDIENEHKKEITRLNKKAERLKEHASAMEQQRDEYKARFIEKSKELYQVKTELEDEKGKNLKLNAQINRDYENSSKPSSQKPNHKKINNNREKTEKKPGGQPGHTGHKRTWHNPTNRIKICAPEKYTGSTDFKATGKTIVKQLIGFNVAVTVTEYSTPEFRNMRTGQRVHADFPEGVVNDVNYDGSVKAFAFLLNNHCNVSIGKVSEFMSDLTDGKLRVSTGMINGLAKEFSTKTDADQKKAFADMLLAPVINTDFTSARVNGHDMNVIVCATPSSVLYFAREHKGHKGIAGTPVEDSQNTLVHDHDRTFYNYGGAHQECLDHVSRYLKDSMDNEHNYSWNSQMRELISEMIHFKNGLNPNDNRNPDQIEPVKVSELEAKYDMLLALAEQEYEYEPPSKYYKDGFNLQKRLREYRSSHLLFLHDRRVPHTNNLSERLLRNFKRKLHQAITLRSADSLDYLCRSLGVLASLRSQGANLYESVSLLFGTG